MGVRVRFAPSPTGYLHIGGARTALFNWLFARRHGGAFVLRIEDTDVERSSWDMVEGILEGLRWLGLDWDEGPDIAGPHAPYFQSQRLDRYRAMAERLVADGRAYYCYCSAETLQEKRAAAEAPGGAWRYDRSCLALAPEEIARLEAVAAPRAVRFKVPAGGETRFADLVHGDISFDHAHLEDFVVLRSDGHPTYHLSVVVDDLDMAITHVVRGDDHVSNTPKQVLLYEAFGASVPQFAHVPLIFGADRKRLSKRHGATSVMEYQRLGYLPEAMVNFLALLGWSPGGDREVFTRDELVAAFSLDGISGGNPVFNPDKLDWFNSQHLARLPLDELAARVEPILREAGLWRDELAGGRRAWFRRVLALLTPRATRLSDFARSARPFFADRIDPDPAAVRKYLLQPDVAEHLAALRARLALVDPFEAAPLEQALRAVAADRGVKAAALIHATRVAATGEAVSPGLFEVLELLGRDRTIERLLEAGRVAAGAASH
jgi:glutamyl-tRNA synthetase